MYIGTHLRFYNTVTERVNLFFRLSHTYIYMYRLRRKLCYLISNTK